MNFLEFEKKKKFSEASGSMAVVDSNVKMELNNYGLFEERLINEEKGLTKIAQAVSPILNDNDNEKDIAFSLYGNNEKISFDKRIGYYDSLYIGYVQEGTYRNNASSGGMGTWIFKELLDKKLIDYVIHVKKNKNPREDTMFKYAISASIEEVKEGAKTRYYPVEISEVMDIVKKTPGRYAVIGIPSFIYSIRLLAKQDKIINERIKFTVGLICGHQKSSKFAESMAFQIGIKPGNLLDIDFRHKILDRTANEYGIKMTGIIDGEEKTIIKPKTELYGQNWGWGLFKPVSSNYTDDVFNETADIVLGDAWLSDYTSDSRGTNIVIIRNSVISELISNAIRDKRLVMTEADKETIFASQAAHYRHTHDELSYRLYKLDEKTMWRPNKRVKASNREISNTRKKIQDLREELSSQSHIAYLRAVEKNDFTYFIDSLEPLVREYQKIYIKINRQHRMEKILKMKPSEIIKKTVNRIQRKLK